MKKSLIKSFDKIIVVLLAILGVFNSCTQTEYGMPYADYELKGVVTDKETSKPIKNIRIATFYGDTIYTDAEGKYALSYCFDMAEYFHFKIEDIDGEENGGEFEAQKIDVKFTNADKVKKGDGHWYEGKYEKTQNIELEKK
jgi:putative lipoprotein (rSAM/lipoprotein system)